jgi:hypothetical protein
VPNLGTFEWGDAIALVALALSIGLAVLKAIEWQAKPDLHVDVDWLAAAGEHTRLNAVVSNRGRARGGLKALLLSPSPNHDPEVTFSHYAMLDRFPTMLERGDLRLFTFVVDPHDENSLTRRLLDGSFTHLLLIDQADKCTPFPIPPRPPDSETRRNRYGRVSKR